MASIHNLLNPVPEVDSPRFLLPSPSPSISTYETEPSQPAHSRKKQKLCKDTAAFVLGKIHGECRYPAYETNSEKLASKHRQHNLRPDGRIMDFARHVPYSSEKKPFLQRTQRDGFEVFHYEFQARGEDKVHTMMWDYNIGLVRTTPLFKCMGYSKTTPAKMLNRNPGLREICHSITGGALVAQGYWMPFEAAKAIATTFCWKIRYALTPVFGNDFPKQCIRPDSEGFGAMVIDPAITRRCREKAVMYRDLECKSITNTAPVLRSPLTPESPTAPPRIRQLRRNARHSPSASSSYTTDSGSNDDYLSRSSTPSIPYCNTWTAANTPRSHGLSRYNLLPSPSSVISAPSYQKTMSRESSVPSSLSSTTSMLLKSRENSEADEGASKDAAMEAESIEEGEAAVGRLHSPDPPLSDEKAAYLLLKLSMDARAGSALRGQKRRAST